MSDPIICAECGSPMVLRQTTKFKNKDGSPRKFYGCSRFPDCQGIHGAHPDGRPLGKPADKATKQLRIEAHAAFDNLWQGGRMSRSAAYRWLQRKMGMTSEECHIGRFDADAARMCMEVCEAAKINARG
jgi:ssDNA-binding Zn-finger/Zn-ribbon topoisomerase 1